jgi:signal transduction histidine kinase
MRRPLRTISAMSRFHRLNTARPARMALLFPVATGLTACGEATPGTSASLPWLFVTVAFIACALARSRQIRPRPTPPSPPPTTGPSPGEPRETARLMEAIGGVALLAVRQPYGLSVACLNAPARVSWPHASAGSPLESLSGLSPAVRSSLDTLQPGQATSFDGWRLVMLESGETPQARYLLCQLPGPSAEGDLFGSTLSHDLRAPIRVVEGFTRIVKEDYGGQLDRVGNDHLDRVLGAASRMNLMIDALLTMARLSAQPLARQPVDLSQLALYVVDDLRRAGAARTVEVEIEPGLGASGDPTLLRLVLENLLGNAWKYTSRTEGARIALRSATREGERAFAVSDNGAGFDMRSADRLFGLFQRLHSANDFPGHGVGLASVRRIVRRHGGDIWAEGRPGQGATFTFTLG